MCQEKIIKHRQLKINTDVLDYYDRKTKDMKLNKLEDLLEYLYEENHIQKLLGDFYGRPAILK